MLKTVALRRPQKLSGLVSCEAVIILHLLAI